MGQFRSSRANQSYLLHLPSYARNVTYTSIGGNLLMRLKLLFGLLTIIAFTTNGQKKILTADSDTIYWERYYQPILTQSGILPIDNVGCESTFRFWDGKKLIELRNSKDSIKGTITFIIKEFQEEGKNGKHYGKKGKERSEMYFRRKELSWETAKQISSLIKANQLLEIPTQTVIGHRNHRHNERVFVLEYTDNYSRSYKTYLSPETYRRKFKEAERLTDFIDAINEIPEIDTLHIKFMNLQPFGKWYTFIGSSTIGLQNTVVK